MLLHRIGSKNHIHDLSGEGGLYYGGRWHKKGTRILYFSEHISLAKLEILANSIIVPKNMSLMTLKIDQTTTCKKISADTLPKGWDGYPYLEALQTITTKWIKNKESLLLKVPSAQAEGEFNFLMNPMHVDIKKAKVITIKDISFDKRLKL